MPKKNIASQDFAAGYSHADLKALNDTNPAAGTSSAPCVRWTIRISKLACPTTAVTKACR
ncbi:MAG: class II lanthipeptide, LchA2/BrtA2 family [Propionibacteriaceae bacterium]|nr:class II lanthipeptide, LchA2/BrtA2 family [Propionibacteriaceae bacterium]